MEDQNLETWGSKCFLTWLFCVCVCVCTRLQTWTCATRWSTAASTSVWARQVPTTACVQRGNSCRRTAKAAAVNWPIIGMGWGPVTRRVSIPRHNFSPLSLQIQQHWPGAADWRLQKRPTTELWAGQEVCQPGGPSSFHSQIILTNFIKQSVNAMTLTDRVNKKQQHQ